MFDASVTNMANVSPAAVPLFVQFTGRNNVPGKLRRGAIDHSRRLMLVEAESSRRAFTSLKAGLIATCYPGPLLIVSAAMKTLHKHGFC